MKPIFKLEQDDTNIVGVNEILVQCIINWICNISEPAKLTLHMPMGDVTLAVTVKPPVYFVGQYYLLYFVHLIVTNYSIIHNS